MTAPPATAAKPPRIVSIDALRGLVMFTMIFVNDLAAISDTVVPPAMKHFVGPDGMTFVDIVFPAFLFIVGMSLPFALGSRIAKGEPLWKTLAHILFRTFALLLIGFLMVNGRPDSAQMGWSGRTWTLVLYFFAILALCAITPTQRNASDQTKKLFERISLVLRIIGFVALFYLAFTFRDAHGNKIISLAPFFINTSWYGILGHIGWAYLIGAIVFLLFRTNRVALLGVFALLLCLFAADRSGMFANTWLESHIVIGTNLGSLPAITVAGLLFVTVLTNPDTASVSARVRFTLLSIAGFSAAGWLLKGLYGISKNDATPTWCLLSCAITAAFWLVLYFSCDVHPVRAIRHPLALAGQNVFLAYLLSQLFVKSLVFADRYALYNSAIHSLPVAIGRSLTVAFVILLLTVGLNRLGFRSKL